MKEATGELNMTVITIIAIAADGPPIPVDVTETFTPSR